MNTYYTTGFEGHYPVGTAAVARAPDVYAATRMLNDALMAQGLKGDISVVDVLVLKDNDCVILCDGNY